MATDRLREQWDQLEDICAALKDQSHARLDLLLNRWKTKYGDLSAFTCEYQGMKWRCFGSCEPLDVSTGEISWPPIPSNGCKSTGGSSACAQIKAAPELRALHGAAQFLLAHSRCGGILAARADAVCRAFIEQEEKTAELLHRAPMVRRSDEPTPDHCTACPDCASCLEKQSHP